jgi:hypothetical protein
MHLPRNFQLFALLIPCLRLGSAGQTLNIFPTPSGPFHVAINTMELIDISLLDLYAPSPASSPALNLPAANQKSQLLLHVATEIPVFPVRRKQGKFGQGYYKGLKPECAPLWD